MDTNIIELQRQINALQKRVDDLTIKEVNPAHGFPPYAEPLGMVANAAFITAYNIPVLSGGNCGSVLLPIVFAGNMAVYSVSVYNLDITLQRSWNWAIYEQKHQIINDSSFNTVDRVCFGETAGETFTATGASVRTLGRDNASPVWLGNGLFWLVIQNIHATQTFGIGTTAGSTSFVQVRNRTKTIPVQPATLDIVGGWSTGGGIVAARVHGWWGGDAGGL